MTSSFPQFGAFISKELSYAKLIKMLIPGWINMQLSKHDISKLKKIVALAEAMISSAAERSARGKPSSKAKRIRRTGKELVAFRKMLKAERKKGVSVADLAKKHVISKAYIYTL